MKRHPWAIAGVLALPPLLTLAQAASAAAPAPAAESAASHASVLKGYVRPEAPKSSPDIEWLAANRALREDGGTDMGDQPLGVESTKAPPMNGMRMPGMQAPTPAASAPTGPHANHHQMKRNGH